MTVCNDHPHHLLHALRLHRLRTLHCSHAAGFGRHLHLNVVWFGKFILRMEFWFVFVCFFLLCNSISCVCAISTLISYYSINHHQHFHIRTDFLIFSFFSYIFGKWNFENALPLFCVSYIHFENQSHALQTKTTTKTKYKHNGFRK